MTASSKLRRVCKVISAAIEKTEAAMVSHRYCVYRLFSTLIRLLSVDALSKAAYTSLLSKHSGCRPGQARYQSEAPRTAGRAEPASGARAGALVPGRWLLRCARSRAGKVRDASSGQHRWREEGRS